MRKIHWGRIIIVSLIAGAIIYPSLRDKPVKSESTPTAQKPLTPEEQAAQEKTRKEGEAKKQQALRDDQRSRALAVMDSCKILLEGAEVDLKRGNIGGNMEMYAIGAMLEVMYSCADHLQRVWYSQESLLKADITALKALESRLASFQQQALPKMRLAFGKRTKETVWVNDVEVSILGQGNTTLKLIGYQFHTNANVQATQEALNDLVTRLRYKILIVAPSDYYKGGAVYSYKPPSDATIAAYDNGFQKLDRTK